MTSRLQISKTQIRNRTAALGYTIQTSPERFLQAQVAEMDCGSCAKTVEAALK